jgi:hypothetical protein
MKFPGRLAMTLLAITCAMKGATLRLPPVTGELSGDFQLLEAQGSPVLHWTATVRGAGAGAAGRGVSFSAQGEGARLQLELDFTAPDEGRWKIEAAEFELAKWFPVLAAKAGGMWTGLTAAGTATVKGSGQLRDGVPSGTVEVTVQQGRLASEYSAWALEGVGLKAGLVVEPEISKTKSARPFEMTVATLTTQRLGARNLFITGWLGANGTIALHEARIEIAGGEVRIDPTTLTLAPLGLEATLHITEVGLQDLAALIPKSFSAAKGRIDGTVQLGWSLADGFRVGAGNLVLGKSETAVVRLAPVPGFLTRALPPRFEPVPRWLGPASTWLSADNPAFADTREIELGQASLELESLDVQLTPDGDELGRTATVKMRAKPIKPGVAVGTVKIDVNVIGPLDSMLKLGINRDLSVELPR